MGSKEKIVKIERTPVKGAGLLPRDFWDIIAHRFFPVLSLTYVSTVVGFAARNGDVVFHLFQNKNAYVMGLIVSAWVSVPAVLWILLKGSHMYHHVAEDWYKIIAGIMTFTLLISFVLFPEMDAYGMRAYFAATIPVLFIMYFFFVKGGLPPVAAHPLSALGLTFLLYGAAINYLY